MDRRMSESLDRYITGNYGEDQFRGEAELDALLVAARNLVEYVREHGGPATDLAIALDKALRHYDA